MAITQVGFVAVILCLIFYQSIQAETVPDIIISEGYLFEQHFATTETGFVLGLYRIPGIRSSKFTNNASNATKPVVLLQHGLATSSDCWVLLGRGSALAFKLADKGYDVWLANSRGTSSSKNHTTLRMTDAKDIKIFNRYSFHLRGTEDLSTTIDYVLKYTGKKKLALYAHSEGASMFYAMGAVNPRQVAKVNSFFAFAPLVFIGNTNSPVVTYASIVNSFGLMGYLYDFLKPLVIFGLSLLKKFSVIFFTKAYTTMPIGLIAGGADGQITGKTLSRLYKFFPTAVTKKSLNHILQLVTSNKFQFFSFLPLIIPRPLGLFGPRKYKLKKIKNIPMYLYFSEGDLLVNQLNLPRFDNAFGSEPQIFQAPSVLGHFDFVYGNDAPQVYEMTYKLLEQHSKT